MTSAADNNSDPSTLAEGTANGVESSTPNANPAPAPKVPFEPSFTWDDPIKLMKSLGHAWREVTDRETPTFLQLIEMGVLRVDVDEPTGFIAVHTEGEAHHAIGIRRDAIIPLAAVLSGKTADEVKRAVALGPAKLEAARREPPKKRGAQS